MGRGAPGGAPSAGTRPTPHGGPAADVGHGGGERRTTGYKVGPRTGIIFQVLGGQVRTGCDTAVIQRSVHGICPVSASVCICGSPARFDDSVVAHDTPDKKAVLQAYPQGRLDAL